MAPPTIEPMLASHGIPAGPTERWAVEPKLDGWRAMVTVHVGAVSVRSRRGRPLEVPELTPVARVGLDLVLVLVLDGELVAGGGTVDDFYGWRRHWPGGTGPPRSASPPSTSSGWTADS